MFHGWPMGGIDGTRSDRRPSAAAMSTASKPGTRGHFLEHSAAEVESLPFVKEQWKYKQAFALDADAQSR